MGMEPSSTYPVTSKTKIRRIPARGSYDRGLAHAILDEALVASVAFVEEGQPYCIPMALGREGERLFLHAASSSRFAMVLASGNPICVSVTLLDGLVLARSAMHHSLNYRSLVVVGSPIELTDEAEKRAALARLIEHVVRGRSRQTREPNAIELRATRVFALELREVSVKTRQGGPIDDPEDLELPYWAGVVPLSMRAGVPEPDATNIPVTPLPPGLCDYDRWRSR
jgi:nitroimidazol reductase NimA-like FMN-containing flavoprotein (pyridoxamine 5'-phosphate oxidase superfamily)